MKVGDVFLGNLIKCSLNILPSSLAVLAVSSNVMKYLRSLVHNSTNRCQQLESHIQEVQKLHLANKPLVGDL